MLACCNGARKSKPQASAPGAEKAQPPPTGLSAQPCSPAPQYGAKDLHVPDTASVDIIFVHGLGGHRDQTWTAKGNQEPWPRVLLPLRCPQARILTFGYDSRITDWHMVSTNRINNHAKNLLHAIVNRRSEDGTNTRPILFVVHSLGGLVTEDALLASDRSAEPHLHSVVDCTHGIIFLGTPHAGAALASWARKLANCVGIVKQANASIVQVLEKDSEVLSRIQADFHALIRTKNRGSSDKIRITCFYEELEVPGIGVIVPLESAILSGYASIGIHEDHMGMTRFSSENDQGFVDITAELCRWTKELEKIISIQSPFTRKTIFHVPFERFKNFEGRRDVLADISTRFKKTNRVAITGIGGVGKSQIAIEWCYIFKDYNPLSNVFWVHADSVVRFQESYSHIARRMKLTGWDDPKVDILNLVSEWLTSDFEGDFLMILDNADSREVLYNPELVPLHRESLLRRSLVTYLPRSSTGKLLVTTRNEKVGRLLVHEDVPMIVNALTMEQGISLLRNETTGVAWDAKPAQVIVETLGALPLAITQAAGYIQNNKITLTEYCELLAESDESLADMLEMDEGDVRRDFASINSVLRTWKLSFEYIKEVDPRAAELLGVMSVLDRNGIPQMILHQPNERQPVLISSLGTLQAFGLITAQYGHGIYTLHRLVQVCTKRWSMHAGIREEVDVLALKAVSRCFPKGNQSNWELCKQLFSHAACFENISFTKDEDKLTLSRLQFRMAWYEWQMGRYSSAEELISKARIQQHSILKSTDLVILETLQLSADIAMELRRYNDCHKIIDEIIEKREREGKNAEDLFMSTCLTTKARVLTELGSILEAEAIHRDVMKARARILGDDHPETISSKAAVALVLQKRGSFRDACKLSQEAADQNTRVLGPTHWETLTCLGILSTSLRRDGQYSKAVKVAELAVEGCKTTLGPTNPRTLHRVNELAIIYRYMGILDKAEALFREALKGYQNSTATEIDASHVAMELALVLRDRGQYDEAIAITRKTLQIHREKLPSGHPHTSLTMSTLANILYLNGQYLEAEPYILEAIAARTELLGRDSADTLMSRCHYARILHRKGELMASENEWRSILTATRVVYKRDDHPHELNRSAEFAMFLGEQKRYDEAHRHMAYAIAKLKNKPDDLSAKKAILYEETKAEWPLATDPAMPSFGLAPSSTP